MSELPYPDYKPRLEMKPKVIDGLSEKLLEQHWKLYEGYVNNTNLLNKEAWGCFTDNRGFNAIHFAEMKRRLGFEYNGMVLHEYYFGNLNAGVKPPSSSSDISKKLSQDFGSVDAWKKEFVEIGKMRGIGWVVTNFDPTAQKLMNFWVTDHEIGNVAGFSPIVAMDVWEHAYLLDYGASANGRLDYINTFFRNLNWEVVAKRLYFASQASTPARQPFAQVA